MKKAPRNEGRGKETNEMTINFDAQRTDATVTSLQFTQLGKTVHVIDLTSSTTNFELSTDIFILGPGHPNKRVTVNLFALGDLFQGTTQTPLDSRGSATIDGVGTIHLDTEFQFDTSLVNRSEVSLLGLEFVLDVESLKDGSYHPHTIFSTIIPARFGDVDAE